MWNDREGIRVLCVDDNPAVVDALRILLSRASHYIWAGWLSSGDRLVTTARVRLPHIVLLDVDMPGRDPFEAIRELSDECPEIRVIILSGHAHRDLINRAIQAGAWGYVAKSDGEGATLEALEEVSSGEFAMSPEVRTVYSI